MPAHAHRRPGLRRDALLPIDRGQTRPPALRRPHRTHQRKRLDPGNHLNSYLCSGPGRCAPHLAAPASLSCRPRIFRVQSTSGLGGGMGRHHKQRPSATWFGGRSPRSRVLLGCAVAVSLLLASRFGVSIALRFGVSVALLGLSVLILCGAVGAGLRFLWSEKVHRLPRRVEGALVGAVVLAVLAGLVPVFEEPQSPSTGADATGPTSGGPTSGRPNGEVPGSAGAVPPGDAPDDGPSTKDDGPSTRGVKPDSARGDSDPFTLS